MVTRKEVVDYLDGLLDIAGWAHADSSRNGLQVWGRDEGTLILGSTDASQQLFEIARQRNAFLVLVHHGLFWDDVGSVDQVLKARLQLLFQTNTNLYAAHLPLDSHPALGNNARLIHMLGADEIKPFGEYHGRKIGYQGILHQDLPISQFSERLKQLLGDSAINVMPNGPHTCHTVGIVSGGAPGNLVAEAAVAGIDTVLVGEAGHTFHHFSREYGINVIAGGHYATETWGVKAVLEALQQRYPNVQTEFIDLPTGL